MDLFEPGSGSRVHDFTGGIAASGLVWTVPIPDGAVVASPDGKQLTVDVHDVAVVDATGGAEVQATVSFQMTWRGRGRAHDRGRGTAASPTDPAAFLGRLFRARARGTFSGSAGGFSFQSKGGARSLFAEVGTEQTGALLPGAVRCAACAAASSDW